MIRKRLYTALFCLAALAQSAVAQDGQAFVIEGTTTKDLKKVKLLYYDFDTDEQIVDSAIVRNGKFRFAGEIAGASYAGLYFRDQIDNNAAHGASTDDFWFYLNPGKNVIDARQGRKAKLVAGDAPAMAYINLKKETDEKRAAFESDAYKAELKELEELRMIAAKKEKELEAKFGTTESIYTDAEYAFVKNNPDNTLSLHFLQSNLDPEREDFEKWKILYSQLSTALKNSTKGQELGKLITSEPLVVGSIARNFTQPDADGKPIQLADLKGKYVLIDFWASWCVPCRQENPNVVKAYQKYKDKNFEIIGISLDNKKESWLKAIEDDKLTWVNVSDLKGWKNEVSQDYQVKAVPTNYLIDPTGKIIAMNLRGEDLEKALAEIFE